MSLMISLRTEFGRLQDAPVSDLIDVLRRLLPPLEDESYHCLRFIDWESLTIFNEVQMVRFSPEWQRISSLAQTAEEQAWVAHIERLAQRCADVVHSQLWFEGS